MPLPSARPGEALAPEAERLEDLAEALAEATGPAERLQVTASALQASGVAPIADARVPGGGGQFVVGASGETLAAWVPGRVPLHKDSLVVIAAPRDGRSELALIEASRLLVASGAFTQVPARSVLVVLGDDVRAPLRLWNQAAVLAVFQVGSPRADSIAGRPVQIVALEADPVQLAARLYEAMRTASAPETSPYTR